MILQKNLGLNANCLLPSLGLNTNCLLPTTQNVNPNFQITNSYPVQYPIQKKIADYRTQTYEPTSVSCAKIVTSNAIPHQTIASSHRVGSQNNLPVHTYQNVNPVTHLTETCVSHFTEPVQDIPQVQLHSNLQSSFKTSATPNAQIECVQPRIAAVPKREESHTMGPMLIAAMNGLCLSRPDILAPHIEEKRIPNDTRVS